MLNTAVVNTMVVLNSSLGGRSSAASRESVDTHVVTQTATDILVDA